MGLWHFEAQWLLVAVAEVLGFSNIGKVLEMIGGSVE